MKEFKGTGVAMVTPFKADNSIDFPALKKLTRHLISGGLDFLVILGTTGEAATLSKTEKSQVIECILEENSGQLPYMIGAGGNNTLEVINEMQSLAKDYAPGAFLSVTPYYNKPSQEGLQAHYKALATATQTPILLYNVPGRTSCNLHPETALKIAAETSGIIGIKEASGSLEQGMELILNRPSSFLVISGEDALTMPMIAAGFDGVISVIANVLPRQFSDMVKAGLEGKMEEARRIHYRLYKLIGLLFEEGNPAGVKQALAAAGICEAHLRLPLRPVSENLKERIKKELTFASS